MSGRLAKIVFYGGLGLFFSHEMDAVAQAEWRLLYVLGSMPDETAMPVFIGLHVPLFGLIIWLTHHPMPRVQVLSRIALAAFLIVHAGLHFRLSDHPLYTFDSMLSQTLIYGGAVCGVLYLVMRGRTQFVDP